MEGRYIVAGLGNPGVKYAGSRHNVGFMVLDTVADRIGVAFRRDRRKADIIEGRLAGVPVILAKPQSYMNNSGGPVTAIRSFFKVPIERVVVIHDELDIPFGSLRLKQGGGDNGHNGLRSITSSLGSPDYLRVRFGIGRPPGQREAANHVLTDFTRDERRDLSLHIARATDAVEILVTKGLASAQNEFNS